MTDLASRLAEFVGKPYGEPFVGPDPVNAPMIRHLTEALGDRNPVYTDEAVAATSVHGEIVAPATSLQVWTMRGLAGRPAEPDHPQTRLMSMVESEGYVGVVATNCEQIYHRYLRLGDVLTATSEVEDITGPKKTGLGEGFFITTLETYRDQVGEVVGEMRFRILKFRPQEPKSKPDVRAEPSDVAVESRGDEDAQEEPTKDVIALAPPGLKTLHYDEIEVGTELPTLVVDVTPTLIVSTAIATRDYQDVHHDRDSAQQKGSKDIFMNILTTNGFVGRFITDWAGPQAILRSVAIRLGAPNYPYDKMTMTGRVSGSGEGIVTVEVRGANSLGDHVTGTVTLSLP